MKSTSFKETNHVYGAGGNPNTDQLAVCVASHEDNGGAPSIISKFKLSKEEIERINETGELWVMVMGTSLPPICPSVWNPFDEIGYKPLES